MRKAFALIIISAAVLGAMFAIARGRTWDAGPAREADDAPAPGHEDATQPSPTDPHPLPDPLVDPRVEISKSERRLRVFSDGAPVKGYRVALGREPHGDKEREGDGRTPEGAFYVCTRNGESQYHRSIGLSYPDAEDAERGLAAGLINKREHRTIVEATRHLRQPPWNTALGGEIMIHGGGTHADWTAGCIALSDEDAEELFKALPLGTPVSILP